MSRVTVVNWNPVRRGPARKISRLLPRHRRVNNFGDLLGPLIVARILARRGLSNSGWQSRRRLLTVGSILRLAREGDSVWGTGINGKSVSETFHFTSLDVRAVRGPLTAAFLRNRGIVVPEVYGDPGLLLGTLWTRDELRSGQPRRALTVIPNLNDLAGYDSDDPAVVDPRRPLAEVLGLIAASDFVTGSSLHAIVVAEALGISARPILSEAEPAFKYDDYFQGTGRAGFEPAGSAKAAVALGSEPPIRWDPAKLLEAFPTDLWHARAQSVVAG